MKKRFLYSVAIVLASLTLGACSSDDDDSGKVGYTITKVKEAPSWNVNWESDTPRPNWQAPTPSIYENWTIMLIQIEEALKPYTSDNDMLALFVNGELRGVVNPAVNINNPRSGDNGKFVLKAYGNEGDNDVVGITLSYYNDRLHQTFSRSVKMKYDMNKVYGLDEDIVPEFVLGSSKYPYTKKLNVSVLKNQIATFITPGPGDMISFYVGNECRGSYTLDGSLFDTSATMYVLARTTGETMTMKYYSKEASMIYSFTTPAIINY